MSIKLEKLLLKSVVLLSLLYFVVHFRVSSKLWNLFQSESPFNSSFTLNLSRSHLYWDTFDVNYFHVQDFRQAFANESNLSDVERIKWRLIRAEQIWRLSTNDLKLPLNAKRSEPLFTCPHSLETLEGKWICGMELFRRDPKPEECTVLRIGGAGDGKFEGSWLTHTNCRIIIIARDTGQYSKTRKILSEMLSREESMPRARLVLSEIGEQKKHLRQLMENHELGWLDILVVEISGGEEEYLFMEQIVTDVVQVLPFAQPILEVYGTSESDRVSGIIKKLEQCEMRPFQKALMEQKIVDAQTVPASHTISFLNLRGKHLLLVGSEDQE